MELHGELSNALTSRNFGVSPNYPVFVEGEVEKTLEFNSACLSRIRKEALRKGVWFKTLDRAERAILDLVPRCMEKPSSPKLIDILAKVIVKIKDALKSQMATLVSQVGKPLARKISHIAQEWGHKTACEWAEDETFWKFLAIMNLKVA